MTEEDEAAFDEFLAARSTAPLRTAVLVCGVEKDGATTLDQDGRLDGKKVAENTYLNDGNMIARVLDDTHGVLVVLEPSLAEKLDAATIEAELIKVAEGLTLAD
ncbi:hypothetical protein [Acrocarpospora sp. B8E8]|uniref:hypothetical protein n=1 Tax=Acrocarpospora sp. B8E8 TaxID=3153572 RepID=UPI00325E7E97